MPGQYRALQGFKDILPGEQPYWRFVENTVTADGRWIVVADGHERIYLIDRLTELPVAQLEGGEWTSTVLFDPSCKLLASACSFQGGGHVSINSIESNGQPTLVHELDRSMVYTPAGCAYARGLGYRSGVLEMGLSLAALMRKTDTRE